MIEQAKQRWQRCSPSERLWLLLGLALLVVTIFWYLIVSPLLNYRDNQQRLADKAQKDLLWMQQQRTTLAYLQQNQPDGNLVKTSLQDAVRQSAQQYNIVLTEIQSKGARLELQLKAVPFNQLLIWLEILERSYAIQVRTLDLVATVPLNGEAQSVVLSLARRQNSLK